MFCNRAPEGWICTRLEGHEGPCAAEPDEQGGRDDKHTRDSRKQFSQYDLDAVTKPLHAEIERLKTAREKIESGLASARKYPPWEFYGCYDAQRCFFCGFDKSSDDDSESSHGTHCLWKLLQNEDVST